MDKTDYNPIDYDGQISIGILRNSANILAHKNVANPINPALPNLFTAGTPVALPFVLFGLNDFPSYNACLDKNSLTNIMYYLNQAVPGITLTVTFQKGNVILFTWHDTVGATTDVLQIFYNGFNSNYSNLIYNSNQLKNNFYLKKILYLINQPLNNALQFNNNIQFIRVSNGGSDVIRELYLNSYLNPYDQNISSGLDRILIPFPPKTLIDSGEAIVDYSWPGAPAEGVSYIIYYNLFYDHHESRKSAFN